MLHQNVNDNAKFLENNCNTRLHWPLTKNENHQMLNMNDKIPYLVHSNCHWYICDIEWLHIILIIWYINVQIIGITTYHQLWNSVQNKFWYAIIMKKIMFCLLQYSNKGETWLKCNKIMGTLDVNEKLVQQKCSKKHSLSVYLGPW